MRGAALFISQFIGDREPFNNLSGIAGFAAGLGFRGLQIPLHDPRFLDLGQISESDYIKRFLATLDARGLAVSELSAHRAGCLLAAHPVYDELLDALAPADARGDPVRRRRRAEQDLRRAIAAAPKLGTTKVAVFSGALAWPFFYPYPPPPAGLIDRAFDELARRWRPLLDEADAAGVDLCFEPHPGQDIHDGATFERFLDRVDGHPRAKILYDPSHLLLQHIDYLGFIDRYGDRIAAFHVKDAEFRRSDRSGVYGGYGDWIDRPGRFRSVGDGEVDFRGVFSRLAERGYDGWATLEWECCVKNAEDGAAEGARFIAAHIIRTTGASFDASMRAPSPPATIDRLLGLAERP